RDRDSPRQRDREDDRRVHADSGVGRGLVGRTGHRDYGGRRPLLRSLSGPARRSARSHRSAPEGMMTIRFALLWEVVALAIDTIRGNKMRSALTVLGVVIGITSILGMTAMIRGFDQSLRQMIAAIGPNTI